MCGRVIRKCGRNPPFHPRPQIFTGCAPGVTPIKYNDAENRNSQTSHNHSLEPRDVFEDAKHEDYVDDDIKCCAKDKVPMPTLSVFAGEPVQRTPVHHL